MATTNIKIAKGKSWTAITMSIMTNRSVYDIEFCVSDTVPPSTLQGHILHPNDGVSANDLPTGGVYVRSVYASAIIVLS